MEKEELEKILSDLRGVDLLGVDLRGVDLRGVDLRGVDLQYANFRGANFRGANFRGANLQYADFQGANFRGANLQSANFQSAILQGANFQSAILQGADLQGVDLWNTVGNCQEIKSMQIDTWSIVYTSDVLQIGCKQFPIEKWCEFTPEYISTLDDDAYDWWEKWKDLIFQIIDTSPAVPTNCK